MKLSYNPYRIFRSSKTPVGLYARQKWLDEAKTDQWQLDFDETVSSLMAEQLPDGSWQQSILATIEHLFGLHLTARSCEPRIDAALDWLLSRTNLQTNEKDLLGGPVSPEATLVGLPFVSSQPVMFLAAAALFLASIFGRDKNQTVLAKYRWLSAIGEKNRGHWGDQASSHNIFRAMVVHPNYSTCRATVLAVEFLANLQSSAGSWGIHLPFYQTLNALAHLKLTQADKQLEPALQWLYDNQNSDGTWSQTEPEWNTFLAIHALRSKKLL